MQLYVATHLRMQGSTIIIIMIIMLTEIKIVLCKELKASFLIVEVTIATNVVCIIWKCNTLDHALANLVDIPVILLQLMSSLVTGLNCMTVKCWRNT